MIEYKGHVLTVTEECLVDEVLAQYRAEQERLRKLDKCRREISFLISDTISQIGLAETKTLLRELLREIKTMEGKDA